MLLEPIAVPSPTFSIIVVNHRTLEHTRRCLDSIRRNSEGDNLELIVVDNDSQDASVEYLRQQHDIRLIERKSGLRHGPRDHGESLNVGLEQACGDYIVVMDSDVIIFRQGWLLELHAILVREGAVLIGPSFYRNFIHACLMMVDGRQLRRIRTGFAAVNRHHEYFDTCEYVTHFFRRNRLNVVKLRSRVALSKDHPEAEPIDGRDTQRWVSHWVPLVARHGTVVDGLAYHGFFGTFVQKWDIYGMKAQVERRNFDLDGLAQIVVQHPMSYSLLTDERSGIERLLAASQWLLKASEHKLKQLAVSVRDLLHHAA